MPRNQENVKYHIGHAYQLIVQESQNTKMSVQIKVSCKQG